MFVWFLQDAPARLFFEALGGRLLEIGGARLNYVAYGWLDTRSLA